MKLLILGVLSSLISEGAFAAWTWSPFMEISENYFHPLTQGNTVQHDITLVFTQNFHECAGVGSGTMGLIDSGLIGEKQFGILSSIVLSAWVANKPIAVLYEGCDGVRARVYGLRIGK